MLLRLWLVHPGLADRFRQASVANHSLPDVRFFLALRRY